MKNKLTQEQINYLFSFCSEQGIVHYDVQIEMVDHFTEWIETNWEKQPYASFLFMISQAKEAFPKEELKEIVKKKESSLKKELVRHYKNEFVSFFTVPKITLSILLFVAFYSIPWNIKKNIFQDFNIFINLINIYTIYFAVYKGKNIVTKNKDEKIYPLIMYDKLQWLMKGQIILYVTISLLAIPSFYLELKTSNQYIIYSIKTIQPLMIIVIISFIHVQVKVNKKIREFYPTAFTS